MPNMDSVHELYNEVEQMVSNLLDGATQVSYTDLKDRFDYRGVPSVLFVGDDFIAFDTQYLKKADYYWGLEYVDEEHRTIIGDTIFFSAEDGRIQEIIDTVRRNKGDEDEE